jgi:hemolysin III
LAHTLSAAKKPKLRGYFHQEAFYVSLGACSLLIARASGIQAVIGTVIFSLGLLFLFGVSAIYHRPIWPPRQRAILKRIDHSAIFVLIAATFTPICLLALPQERGTPLLMLVWFVALAGIMQSIFWVKAPKIFTAVFYVLMGWLALPYMADFKNSLGSVGVFLILGGGIAYTIGAVFYALKWPRIFPQTFGYHELFHFLTVIGAALHFIAIYRLIS